MKLYCQFKILSTGYISGTIPPQFSENNKKPIYLLGSNGVYILDARKSIHTLVNDCIARKDKMKRSDIIGFEIIKANSFLDKGILIYKTL